MPPPENYKQGECELTRSRGVEEGEEEEVDENEGRSNNNRSDGTTQWRDNTILYNLYDEEFENKENDLLNSNVSFFQFHK